MPLESIQNSLHIRRKKNDLVFQNIARLWDIHKNAKSHQEILDGLHPWNAPTGLKFENTQPYFLGIIGVLLCLSLYIDAANGYLQITFAIGIVLIFCAWLSIEHSKSITEIIEALQSKVIGYKYGLDYFATPPHLNIPMQSHMLVLRLKNMFPLFDLGSIANDFPLYASCYWEDEQGKSHPVLVFQYRYVTEITYRDKHGDNVRVKEVEKFKYGVFVFEVNKFQGLAISSRQNHFLYPYTIPWKTSDIQLTRKLNIFGTEQMSIAKQLPPSQVLKIAEFFQHQDGSLLFHPQNQCLCFLGDKNLFQISAQKREITDISTLRGHLRTFKLPYLEQLKSDITTFLQ